MQLKDYLTIAVAVLTIFGGFVGAIKWMVKHYLAELKPNGGSSVSDRLNRVENRVDDIYKMLCEKD